MNNMKTIFLCLAILMFLVGGVSFAAGTYLVSAHGNSTHGVDREDTTQYATGHCAHCHEQHASIGGTQPDPADATPVPSKFCLLADNFDTTATPGAYDQDDNACFYCHCNAINTLQDPDFFNYSYSRTFGGYTSDTTASIMDAFNLTSYHNLKDVIDYAAATWTTTFTTDNNPCCACHNPHLAKRNKVNPGNPAYTAISKPSAHDELWGDDDTEGMDNYPFTYQAPYYYAVTPTNYEPANNATSDGSNLPNYAAFCLDCHVNAVPKSVGVPAKAINWVTTDQHGQAAAGSETDHGELKAPYVNANSGDYALSCTDCHEPHGSSNEWLLRTEVNAKKDISITTTTPGVWYEFCTACHSVVLGGTGSHSSVTSESSSCSSTDNSCHKHGAQF